MVEAYQVVLVEGAYLVGGLEASLEDEVVIQEVGAYLVVQEVQMDHQVDQEVLEGQEDQELVVVLGVPFWL